jgi:hypothetical protein
LPKFYADFIHIYGMFMQKNYNDKCVLLYQPECGGKKNVHNERIGKGKLVNNNGKAMVEPQTCDGNLNSSGPDAAQ